ncbi:DUF5676 family membrane protein [Pseudaestuariivita atlantica]|uniref:Uncharacterized protein n=1 Tax=Pseudaestuariivita atlantica TaxID=1317121 RepID=A0A0L1JS56_9RHOB|nr:DUF5676 family membrane protein [Pseudaestuariivita atlantica]KNG94580.1 hypothetical protein ATO11_04010 [Pseudaestuariivita atlantica]
MAHSTDTHAHSHVPIAPLAWSLGIFFAITYVICVLFDLVFPGQSMTSLWLPLLPWVNGISLGGFVLGLVETVLYGWFVALIFAPLYNFFADRAAG